ncbi:putative AC9 transposase [Fusarium oxysporum f. sp. albedinis]|nr:putative AC9 transposase [Fusarium oxysporum f. sp. albedinis]
MRRKKPREEQFTILVKTELLCHVSYPYEYGAGAMLSSSHTPGSCKRKCGTELDGSQIVERSWRGWVVGDGPETALLWGSEYQDQIVRTVNRLITTLCLGSRST